MSGKLIKCLASSVLLITLLCIGALVYIRTDESRFHSETELQQITFLGTYEVDNNGKLLPFNGSIDGLSHDRHHVTVTGTFSEDIPAGRQLMLRIDNLKVTIYAADKKIYSFGEKGTFPHYARSAGNGWDSLISPGISSDDYVRIELENLYTNHSDTAFSVFFQFMYYGYEGELITSLIRSKAMDLLLAVFIFCLGIIAIVYCILLYPLKKVVRQTFCFAGLSLSAGLWFFIDFNVQCYLIPLPVFNNSLDIVCMIITSVFLVSYFILLLHTRWKILLAAEAALEFILLPAATAAQLMGIYDYYDFLNVIIVFTILEGISIPAMILYENIRFSDKINHSLIDSLALVAGMFLQIFGEHRENKTSLFWFKLGFFIFLILQFWHMAKSVKGIIADSTKAALLEEQKQELIEKVQKDPLTGLYNKSATQKQVASALHTGNPDSLAAFLMIDIDYFKKINDTLGHAAGDSVILIFAGNLRKQFRDGDIVGRIGGDEFAVFIWVPDEVWICEKARKINAALAENITLESGACSITASIGIALAKCEDAEFESLYHQADEALYRAKAAGRNQYSL